MNRFFKTFFTCAAASVLLFSCSDDNADYDRAEWYAYTVVAVEGDTYYFVGDDGETYYPGDTSRIGRYSTEDKEGKRALIYFNYLIEDEEGYDHNVALYEIIDILTKEVDVASTSSEVKEFGDDPLQVLRIRIDGSWLDIAFGLWTENGATHKMTLLDNRSVEAPSSMPEDYQYLEFRQLADNNRSNYLGGGHVAYHLGEYHPAVTGKSGLYIRIKNLDGNVEYITLKYSAGEENKVSRASEALQNNTSLE